MHLKFLAAAAIAATVSSCATPPEKIKPIDLPESAYMTRSCQDLRADKMATAQKLETSTQMQKQAVNSDALGVFLVGLPVGSMAGGERGSEVAVYKGQSAAIDRALKAKGC